MSQGDFSTLLYPWVVPGSGCLFPNMPCGPFQGLFNLALSGVTHYLGHIISRNTMEARIWIRFLLREFFPANLDSNRYLGRELSRSPHPAAGPSLPGMLKDGAEYTSRSSPSLSSPGVSRDGGLGKQGEGDLFSLQHQTPLPSPWTLRKSFTSPKLSIL